MRIGFRASAIRFSLSLLAVFALCTSARAAFSPPSAVTFNASAYGNRALLANSTGVTALAAYVSPAQCAARANLYSYNVMYSIPLFSLVGRAGFNLNLTLNYNSKAWIKSGSTVYFDGEQGWPAPGWRLGFGRIDGVYAGSDGYNHYYYIAPTGDIHDLRYDSSDSLYESTDSTYVDFNDSTGILRMKDGMQITFALQGGAGGYVLPTKAKDRNGNYITINYTGTGQQISSIVDTVGRTTNFSYNGDGTLNYISKSGFANASRTWTFGYTSTTLAYSFASSLTVNSPTSGKLLTSITFPNSTKQVLAYNSYGQLTEADIESSSSSVRGKFLTGWNTAPGGGWTNSPTPSEIGNYDGISTNYWTLSFGSYTTSVTDPTSVATTTSFVNDPGYWDDGLPNQTQIGATALKTTVNTWASDTGSINPHVTKVLTTLNDTGQQSEVQTDYTTYGNLSELREYDFGIVLARKTDYTYVTGSSYIGVHILNLPSSKIIYDSGGTARSRTVYSYDGTTLANVTSAPNHDDTNYGTGFVFRGLLTTLTQYTDAVTPAGPITHSATFDILGNRLTATADCCVQKQFNFSSSTGYSQPDSVVSGSGTTLTVSSTYDSYTGLLAGSTDENSQTTSYGYDTLDRRISLTRPDSTVISTSYDDASANPSTTVTTPITSATSVKKQTLFDGLGRSIRSTVLDISSTIYSKTDTQYDGLGRVYQVSLPYTGTSASYWTQNQYDPLGRLTKGIPPDGSSSTNNVSVVYSGNSSTATDQTGKQRKAKADALGRQVEVDEPDPTSGNSLTLVTTYTYDPLDNVTSSVEGVQTRSYLYDGLGRMTSETSPEAGTSSYQYNIYGKRTQRTDARGVVTTYAYDTVLNRLTGISYNVSGTTATSTPSVSYSYGTSPSSYNNGRLLAMTDGLGSETYTYDQLGRRIQIQRVIYNVSYNTSYTYNLASQIATMTYPSGRVLDSSYDAIGRASTLKNNATGANYATSFAYNVAHQITGFTYGNGASASYGYSVNRLQMTSVSYAQGGTTVFGSTYSYSQSGNNDGEIASITDNVDSGRSAAYSYDALGRLTAASTSGSTNYPAWGLSWTYDRYGNRTAQSTTLGGAPSTSPVVNSATNRISSMGGATFSYDSNGNIIQDDQYKYAYDAENREVLLSQLSGTAIAGYVYDGNSMRVVKVWGASRTFDIFAGSQVISEFEDASSNTYTSGTTPQNAPADSNALVLNQYADRLTTRYTADQNGNNANAQGHYPFGEIWYGAGQANASVRRKFTSYVQDSEAVNAGMTYAIARESSGRLGRFYETDPKRRRIGSPQRLNLYNYAAADPINRRDPSGKDPDDDTDCEAGLNDRLNAAISAYQSCKDYQDDFKNKRDEECGLLCADPATVPACFVCLGISELIYNHNMAICRATKAQQAAAAYAWFQNCRAGQAENPGPPGGGGPGGPGGSFPGNGTCDPLSPTWLDCITGVPIGVRGAY